MVSRLPGRAHLWVDDAFAVEFETGRFTEPREWIGNGFALRFLPRRSGDYHSGAWVLYLPKARIEAGVPVRLRVSHVSGHRDASFMIKARADTAQHEKLSLPELRAEM